MDIRVDHVHVNTTNLEASIVFYTGGLGGRLLRRVASGPKTARREVAYVTLGQFMIELLPVARLGQGTGSRPFSFAVDDLDGELEMLEGRGIRVTEPARTGNSFDGRMAAIADPGGAVIELRQWDGDGRTNLDWQPSAPGYERTG